jgi:hypothetical protein
MVEPESGDDGTARSARANWAAPLTDWLWRAASRRRIAAIDPNGAGRFLGKQTLIGVEADVRREQTANREVAGLIRSVKWFWP